MRPRLEAEAEALDSVMRDAGHKPLGGTSLFRLYDVGDAPAIFEALARRAILARVFPYSQSWMRLGLPGSPQALARLKAAL